MACSLIIRRLNDVPCRRQDCVCGDPRLNPARPLFLQVPVFVCDCGLQHAAPCTLTVVSMNTALDYAILESNGEVVAFSQVRSVCSLASH